MTRSAREVVWLYGSHARGDADDRSDVDVLIVADHHRVSCDFDNLPPGPTAISRYSWCEIQEMAAYGSLFLQHLHLEGQPLNASREIDPLARLLDDLRPYQRARSDLDGFHTVLSDVAESLADGASVAFELAVLGTLIRHTAILGCAVLGMPCFRRLEPVERLTQSFGLPRTWAHEFATLYDHRLYADRRDGPAPPASQGRALEWSDRARIMLQKMEEVV